MENNRGNLMSRESGITRRHLWWTIGALFLALVSASLLVWRGFLHLNPAEYATFRGHADWVNCLEFSPQDSMLASGGADGTIVLWDVTEKTMAACLQAHSDGVNVVAFSPDGKTLASGGLDQIVRMWDV